MAGTEDREQRDRGMQAEDQKAEEDGRGGTERGDQELRKEEQRAGPGCGKPERGAGRERVLGGRAGRLGESQLEGRGSSGGQEGGPGRRGQ